MRESEIGGLVRAALDDEFDGADGEVSALARRSLRIASLRRDFGNQLWLQLELIDPQPGQESSGSDPAASKIVARMRSLLPEPTVATIWKRAFEHWLRNRTVLVDGEEKVYGFSLGQIEKNRDRSRIAFDSVDPAPGLSPADTFYAAKAADAARGQLIPALHNMDQVLERVKTSIHSFLVQTESELADGQVESSIFLRAQSDINAMLAALAPNALETFVAAQERLAGGSGEDLALALTSCRRMLKALADALYPAVEEKKVGADGVSRAMTDEAYRNRLLQFVQERLDGHGQTSVLKSTVENLGSRLKALDSLASKGVHGEVNLDEAETCVVWTYLLAGDLLRIAKS